MAKPQVYINLAQVLTIGGATALGLYYLSLQRRAVGIQKIMLRERIKDDAAKVASIFTRPWQHYM